MPVRITDSTQTNGEGNKCIFLHFMSTFMSTFTHKTHISFIAQHHQPRQSKRPHANPEFRPMLSRTFGLPRRSSALWAGGCGQKRNYQFWWSVTIIMISVYLFCITHVLSTLEIFSTDCVGILRRCVRCSRQAGTHSHGSSIEQAHQRPQDRFIAPWKNELRHLPQNVQNSPRRNPQKKWQHKHVLWESL